MNVEIQRAMYHIRTSFKPSTRFSRPRHFAPAATSARYLSFSSTCVLKQHQHLASTPQSSEAESLPRCTKIQQYLLPTCCPGCGALTQDELSTEAGYYSASRKAVKEYQTRTFEDDLFTSTIGALSSDQLAELNIENAPSLKSPTSISKVSSQAPYCDRCHQLIHHNQGTPIAHPTLAAIEAIISASPHSNNHIWHIIDAADFPMSLILDMDKRLSLAYLRTRNRRAKDRKYVKGKQADMSFIVTRSDLLAPKKEMVDTMVPKLREILRDALGTYGKQMRLGNVHFVSADRGWWTKNVKEKLLDDIGANWLVGKVNVGKSKLFDSIFPKGTNQRMLGEKALKSLPHTHHNPTEALATLAKDTEMTIDGSSESDFENHDDDTVSYEARMELSDTFSLLPPAQPLTQYPVMPIASELPGTTASPIRIPFRSGKSELIDLPGLHRGSLENYVRPESRLDLIMTNRIVPERIVMKPGTSLLLGGLIRIMPVQDDIIILAHGFTPLKTHLTSNLKAAAFHTGQVESGVESIVLPEARSKMASAGIFKLKDDITRTYAGPLVRSDAAGLKPERLPFIVYGTDILIEGVGWVELQAQVRKPKSPFVQQQLLPLEQRDLQLEIDESIDKEVPIDRYPEVEIFSPEGKHIGQRACICAYSTGGPRSVKKGARPRRSMVSVKNQRKPMQSRM